MTDMIDAAKGIYQNEEMFDALLRLCTDDDLARWHANCVKGARDVGRVRSATGYYDETKMIACVEIGRKIQAFLTARGADLPRFTF